MQTAQNTGIEQPLISIITISYNAALTIEETIQSVINQSYPNIEYILIDGKSTDGTLDIIKKYEQHISYWISEPDNGIYDAMNKGIHKAKGEWINFMNCGDYFCNNEVISNLFRQPIPTEYSVVYGNSLFAYDNHIYIEKKETKGNFKYMPACHQSIFCRTKLMKEMPFNTKYRIAADFDFFHKLYYKRKLYLYKDINVATFDATNGISSQNKYLRNKEFICIKEKNTLKRNWLLTKLKIKYLFRKKVQISDKKEKYKILYDHQIFTLQRIGGISRYFCEIISRLSRPATDILIRFSLNYYIHTYNVKTHLIQVPHFIYKHCKKILEKKNEKFVCRELTKGEYIFHPTYYNPYFLKYIGNNPYVVTVHDMIHEKFPSSFKNAEEIKANKKETILKANRIIAISENTKKDIIDILKVSPDKIDVIYHGTSMTYKSNIQRKISFPYILFVGDRTEYKNFNRLLNTFSKIAVNDNSLHLICTGLKFNKKEKEEIKHLKISSRVHHIRATDSILADLYQQALAFVFPSLYEGFGIPILEAFACKCPVILSNTSCFPEIADKAGAYFNPYDEKSMKEAILDVIYNESKRQEFIKLGEERLKIFSWDQAATKADEVYTKVWEERKRIKHN